MRVTRDRVVTVGYEIRGARGRLIDATDPGQPFSYVHGIGQMIPGFEAALEGCRVGDRLEFEVEPEAGYGVAEDRLVLLVPRERLLGICEPCAGLAVPVRDNGGAVRVARIVEVLGNNVLLDANHPLAGKLLRFRVEVLAVRRAHADELRLRRVRAFSQQAV